MNNRIPVLSIRTWNRSHVYASLVFPDAEHSMYHPDNDLFFKLTHAMALRFNRDEAHDEYVRKYPYKKGDMCSRFYSLNHLIRVAFKKARKAGYSEIELYPNYELHDIRFQNENDLIHFLLENESYDYFHKFILPD